MSLSSHLKDKQSPVRLWLEQHFPETRSVSAIANQQLHSAGECPLPASTGSDSSLVGTAIDYLLRACLRTDGLQRTTAATGAARLAAVEGIADRAIVLQRETVDQIVALEPGGAGEIDDPAWRRLAELCLILARFEQYRRNPRAVEEAVAAPLFGYDGTVLGLIPALGIAEASIEDLAGLGRAAWQDIGDLRDAEPLHLNPRFVLSPNLGGADADLIYGDTLLDWKSNTPTNIVGREELWQLIGYALADTDDAYGIRRVEIGALRWRSAVSWHLQELLADLASEPPGELADLRMSFAATVAKAGPAIPRPRGINVPPRPGPSPAVD
jgi:hypothetical protein